MNRKYFSLLFVMLVGWIIFLSLSTYRTMAFNTTQYDDYSGYVSYIATNGRDGAVPYSPFRERFLSVLPAALVQPLVPVFKFSNETASIDDTTRRSMLAISVVNSMCLMASIFILYFVGVRINPAVGRRDAKLVLPILFLLTCSNFIPMTGVDPVAWLIVSLFILLHVTEKNAAALVLLLISSFINEKIALCLMPLFFVYAAFGIQRTRYLFYFLASLLSLSGYFIYRRTFGEGSNDQLDYATYLDSFYRMLGELMSVKAFVLNLFPVLLVVAPLIILRTGKTRFDVLRIGALASVAVLLLASFAANVMFNMGRIVMYVAPVVAYWMYWRMQFDRADRA